MVTPPVIARATPSVIARVKPEAIQGKQRWIASPFGFAIVKVN
jgi:hypothetical protein